MHVSSGDCYCDIFTDSLHTNAVPIAFLVPPMTQGVCVSRMAQDMQLIKPSGYLATLLATLFSLLVRNLLSFVVRTSITKYCTESPVPCTQTTVEQHFL